MEFKTDALVIRSADYGENDKIVTLLTADKGKISAAMKGVKKAGAKLKFASQPFCFAEYVIVSRGGRNTVTGASLHDGFFSLREDITSLCAAAVVAEACDLLLYEGMAGGKLLVEAVRCLGMLCEQGGAAALLSFLLSALSLAGYPLSAGNCPVCGGTPRGRMSFDMAGGVFCCKACFDGVPASEATYRSVRAACGEGEGSEDGNLRALRLVGAYFREKTDAELRSLPQYLAVLGGSV